MKKKHIILAFTAASIFALVGCASHPVQFDDYDKIQGRRIVMLPEVTVSASSFALFDLIPIGSTSREQRIKNRIMSQSGADALIGISISSKHTWCIVGVKNTITVTATPVRFVDRPVLDAPTVY